MSVVTEIEQHLIDNDVFESGIDNRPCHPDSYMSTLNYVILDAVFKESLYEHIFTKEQWREAADYWESQNYLVPTLGLLGITINRWLKNYY